MGNRFPHCPAFFFRDGNGERVSGSAISASMAEIAGKEAANGVGQFGIFG